LILPVAIGVRGGGSGGAAAPPGLKNFRANSVFRANASCSTFGMWKVYSIQLKFSGKLFFRASANWSKFLNVKRRFNTVKNFRATVFSGQAQVAQKFWMQKVHSIQWNFSGPLCFSGQALVAQKSCMIKRYIQYYEFRAPSVFQGKRKLLKTTECKKYIQLQWKFQGKLCFQGKHKLLKILNVKSIFNTVNFFRAALFFLGKRKLLKNCELWNIFNSVYIHLGAIRAIWASVVCNLDQSRDWL